MSVQALLRLHCLLLVLKFLAFSGLSAHLCTVTIVYVEQPKYSSLQVLLFCYVVVIVSSELPHFSPPSDPRFSFSDYGIAILFVLTVRL